MDWKSWYLDRAKVPADAKRKRLIWDEIKPGCSKKQLAALAKNVLDMDDPLQVDWCSVRATHFYLAKDNTNHRALMSGVSNMTRMVSKGTIRKNCNWFRVFLGWSKTKYLSKTLEIIDHDKFLDIVLEVTKNQPHETALGLSAIFHMAYYTGLKAAQLGHIRASNMFTVDGKVLVFASGRLIELPPHVLVPLKTYLRTRKPIRSKDPALFKIEHKQALGRYPTLTDTYTSLARMRG